MEVLNKEVEIQTDRVAITELIRTNYTKEEIEARLNHLERQKIRLVDDNVRLIAEFNRLTAEENEYTGYLAQLTVNGIEAPAPIVQE